MHFALGFAAFLGTAVVAAQIAAALIKLGVTDGAAILAAICIWFLMAILTVKIVYR